MAYSSENSCKRGCSCDSCKGSHKKIQSEGFKQKAAKLVDKTKDALRHGAEVVIRNQLHTPDNFTTPAAMAAPFVVGGAAAVDKFTNNAISHTAKKAANTVINTARNFAPLAAAVAENSNYIGSPQHYNDLVDRHKKDLENINKRKSEGPLVHQHLQMIAQKSLENVQNHPLHPKIKEERDMLSESHFKVGDIVGHNSKFPIQKIKPRTPHEVVKVVNPAGIFGTVTYHLKNPKTGEVHPVVNAHTLFRKVVSEELKPVEDVVDTLPLGVEKQGPGEKYGNKAKSVPAVKPNPTTGIVPNKTGEGYKKMSNDKKYSKLAETAFGSLNRSNPFRSVPLKEEVKQINEISLKKASDTLTALNQMGHEKQDPATTRFVRQDLKAFPSRSGEDNVTRSLDNMARHIERKHGRAAAAAAAHAAIHADNSYGGAWASKKFRDLAAEHEPKKMEEEVEYIDEGDVIQFPGKPKPTPKPSKVITTATRRPPGPRPVKENLNQRYPDVEKDITAIMKESYKKKKMMENATNMHIATPEQREDWLNVGRGSMDVLDYINKYKV